MGSHGYLRHCRTMVGKSFLWQFTAQERIKTLNHGNIGYTLVHREEICRDWWGIYPSVTPSFFQYKQIYSVTVRKGIPYHCFTEARRGSSEQRIPLLKCGCCCCCTQSLMFETRQICRVVSEVQQLHCDEYMAQRQCVHEGALDMCTLKIHSMWFSPFLC